MALHEGRVPSKQLRHRQALGARVQIGQREYATRTAPGREYSRRFPAAPRTDAGQKHTHRGKLRASHWAENVKLKTLFHRPLPQSKRVPVYTC